MPPFALTVLKMAFLALLYLFVWRALRAVAVDVRARPDRPGPGGPAEPTSDGERQTARRGRPPRTVRVVDETGARDPPLTLEGTLRVGRDEGCQIRLSDAHASQVHARLFDRDGAWFVEDLGSTNGTFLNEEPVTVPTEVRSGDRIGIGRTVLELTR